jgi:hypothetical protein
VKRAALLLLVLLTGGCAAAPTPTRDALVQALDKTAPAASTDITHIACQPVAGDPAELACRWRQRYGREWQGWQSHLARSDTGWRLVEPPTRRP